MTVVFHTSHHANLYLPVNSAMCPRHLSPKPQVILFSDKQNRKLVHGECNESKHSLIMYCGVPDMRRTCGSIKESRELISEFLKFPNYFGIIWKLALFHMIWQTYGYLQVVGQQMNTAWLTTRARITAHIRQTTSQTRVIEISLKQPLDDNPNSLDIRPDSSNNS